MTYLKIAILLLAFTISSPALAQERQNGTFFVPQTELGLRVAADAFPETANPLPMTLIDDEKAIASFDNPVMLFPFLHCEWYKAFCGATGIESFFEFSSPEVEEFIVEQYNAVAKRIDKGEVAILILVFGKPPDPSKQTGVSPVGKQSRRKKVYEVRNVRILKQQFEKSSGNFYAKIEVDYFDDVAEDNRPAHRVIQKVQDRQFWFFFFDGKDKPFLPRDVENWVFSFEDNLLGGRMTDEAAPLILTTEILKPAKYALTLPEIINTRDSSLRQKKIDEYVETAECTYRQDGFQPELVYKD